MNATSSGGEAGRKAYPAKAEAKTQPSSCSFCWFVLTIYPTLKGMTPRDAATFRQHLRKVHGLTHEIAP